MRTVLLTALALLGFSPAAWAGVYNLHRSEPARPAHKIPGYIFQLRAAAQPPKGELEPDSPRALCLEEVARFEPMLKDGTLGTVEAITLSSAYVRLGKTREAVRVLRNADQSHFLVQANLAGAYQAAGELELAHRHQQTALDLWPRAWAGWTSGMVEWLRECEQYNLRLLASRLDESRRGNLGAAVGLDPLFPGVRFVSDSGKYAPGELSRKMTEKLPKDAINIVLQLVTWQPNDKRLCWLLGELFNAHGKVGPAYELLFSLVNTDGLAGTDLRQHLKILEGGKRAMDKLEQPSNCYLVMSELMMIPRGTLGVPGAGDVAYYHAALAAPAVVAPMQEQPPPPPQQPPQPVSELPVARPLPFNLVHTGVSFAFGVLVATLLGLQWRQWRRRRRALDSVLAEEPAPPPTSEAIVKQPSDYVRQGPP